MSRATAERMYDEDPLRFAAEASDYGWFQITGRCGGCGLDVETTPGPSVCTCTDCGCGPHAPFDIGRAAVPHEQLALTRARFGPSAESPVTEEPT